MTNTLIQEYRELIALTKQFLSQDLEKNTSEISTNRVPENNKHKAVSGERPLAALTISSQEATIRDELVKIAEKAPSIEKHPQTFPTQTTQSDPPKQASTKDLPAAPLQPSAPQPQIAATSTPASLPSAATPSQRGPKSLQFVLEPLEASSGDIWEQMAPLIQKEFPNLTLSRDIPDDSEARALRHSWKDAYTASDIVLLSFQEPQKQSEFLAQIANAITILIRPAKVMPALKIEQEKGWEKLLASPSLRLIIASDYAIYSLPELMKHYKEFSKNAEHFFGKVPLFLLADLSLYLREPLLKPSLWRALQKYLNASFG